MATEKGSSFLEAKKSASFLFGKALLGATWLTHFHGSYRAF
jgi:hypothetical protein